MLLILTVLVVHMVFPGNSQTYPVFGTKRYHRSTGNAQIPVPASLVQNPASYYSAAPKYYYEQPPVAYAQPSYHENYPDENEYYHYPRQEYYGMPTYRGEYKPTPYYYAHGPSYSYYDDREIAANPLDDLHEEMLQEDERERQRELVPATQEGWFENGGQNSDLTNNFLKNLIAYNQQIESQQQQQELLQQQLEQQQRMELNEQRQEQDYQKDYQKNYPKDYAKDYAKNYAKDYPKEYAKSYQNDQAPVYDEYSDYPSSSEYEYGSEQPESVYNLRKHDTPDLHRAKNSDVQDENERQLKLLAHTENQPQTDNNQQWQLPSATGNHQHQSQQAGFAPNEADPEYDDTWISWDRKRSGKDSGMKMFPQQQDESIAAFTNRKPALFVEKIASTKKPSSKAASFESTASMTTSTLKPRHNGKFSGQKEVVLPRPAVLVQQPHYIFPTPAVGVIQDKPHDEEDEKRSKLDDSKTKVNVFDTIKQLIDMQQEYRKNPSFGSKLQKRFVSNEENLVHELDNLRRRSV